MKGFIELTKREIDIAQKIYTDLHAEESISPIKFTVAISNIAAIIPMSSTKNGVKIDYYAEVSLFNPSITIQVREAHEEIKELLRESDPYQE